MSRNRRSAGDVVGVLLLDKPAGMTSFDVVRRVRGALGVKKVGHAGTLDPFATGLLVVCVGRPATRCASRFMAGDKQYRGVIRLGVETATQDPEGEVVRRRPVTGLDADGVEAVLAACRGTYLQRIPAYSAAKHEGKPLYWYARRGIRVDKPPRPVRIHRLELLALDPEAGTLTVDILCSPGTYVRSLAADIGERLGCGGHLQALTRLGSGDFRLEECLDARLLERPDARKLLLDRLMPLEAALARCSSEEGVAQGESEW